MELAKKVSTEGLRLPPPAGAPLPLLQMMARCWAKPSRRPEFEQLLVVLRKLFQEHVQAGSRVDAS